MYLHTTLAAVFVAVSMQVMQPLNRFCHGGGGNLIQPTFNGLNFLS